MVLTGIRVSCCYIMNTRHGTVSAQSPSTTLRHLASTARPCIGVLAIAHEEAGRDDSRSGGEDDAMRYAMVSTEGMLAAKRDGATKNGGGIVMVFSSRVSIEMILVVVGLYQMTYRSNS